MIVVPQADLLEMFNSVAAQGIQGSYHISSTLGICIRTRFIDPSTFKFETFEPQMKYIKSLTLMVGPSKEVCLALLSSLAK